MGTRARAKPEHLASKLLAIRQHLRLSQSQLAVRLDLDTAARVSEFEHGKREPTLAVLLSYARLAGVPLDRIVDDASRLF